MEPSPGRLHTFLLTDLVVDADGVPAPMVSAVKDEVLGDADMALEMCKIGMVRHVFGVSDFNIRNVLADIGQGSLYSIDENVMGLDSGRAWSRISPAPSPVTVFVALEEVLGTLERPGLREDLAAAIDGTGLSSPEARDRLIDFVFARAATLAREVDV